jgi:hypothetical protein
MKKIILLFSAFFMLSCVSVNTINPDTKTSYKTVRYAYSNCLINLPSELSNFTQSMVNTSKAEFLYRGEYNVIIALVFSENIDDYKNSLTYYLVYSVNREKRSETLIGITEDSPKTGDRFWCYDNDMVPHKCTRDEFGAHLKKFMREGDDI